MSMPEIEHNIVLLREGWDERIEYRVRVGTDTEARANTVRMAGLLAQLRAFEECGDPGPANGALRGSPNKSGSRPPGKTAGFMLLDEITCEITYWVDRVLIVTGRDRTTALDEDPLHVLLIECYQIQDTNPGIIADVAQVSREWVRKARRTLGHDQGQQMFDGMVCEDCGGALAVSREAATATAVRCIGGPMTNGCGRRYERDQWLELYRASS